MYLEPLSKTSTEILAFLSSKIRESFTVRQIAEAIKKDYKITHTMTMRLNQQKYIIAEKKPPVTYCKLNLKGNTSLLAYIEGIRASKFFEKHKDIQILTNELAASISLPFHTIILFGSYVKEAALAKSDLDLIIIIPGREFEKEIEAAVGSVQHVSPVEIHETILTYSEFLELIKEKKPNVAWEAIDNKIVPYGAEALFKMLEEVL
jgi:predicted nucleotidyltransferase